MQAIERAVLSAGQRALLARIEAHPFERADHAFDFTQRLARDRGWSLDFARGAVREYRRFCFLAIAFETPVTPSEEVDEVWHQHLTYSRDYWDIWCTQVLQGRLHHDPTAGGASEQSRYHTQYAETLARYEAYFGPPDLTYWPATHRRFRACPRYRTVDSDRVFVFARPTLPAWLGRKAAILSVACVAMLTNSEPALALPLNPLDWTARPFLTLYGFLLVAALAFAFVQWTRLREGPGRSVARDLDLVELAYLGGGRARAASAVILGFIDAKAAKLNQPSARSAGSDFAVDDRGLALAAPLESYRGLVRGQVSHKAFVDALGPGLDRIARKLAGRGLVPSEGTLAQFRRQILFVFGSVAAFGLLKLVVGMSRDKPVEFLSLLIVVTVVAGLIFVRRPAGRTRLGDDTLADYRQRHQRATSSPRESEVLFAFALSGAAILAGTHLADYQRLHSRSDGGSSSSGCSSGGSGGGSGCGGCGGGD